MGQPDAALALVTDLVRGMARADGPAGRVDALLNGLGNALGADLALLLQGDAAHARVRVLGHGGLAAGCSAEVLARQVEPMSPGDPLLGPVRRGNLAPRSVAREPGGDWPSWVQCSGWLRLCGGDQACTVPLVGGAGLVVVVLARTGGGFTDEQLHLLAAVRPALAAVVDLTGLPPFEAPEHRPHLTGRESEVLGLLARGHTCSRIGRILGTSPRTVEAHLGRIYTKLGVRDRLSAVLAAHDLALLPSQRLGPAGRERGVVPDE